MRRYVLTPDHRPVPEDDLHAWARWFGEADRHVARTKVAPDVLVSTVFLGIDHRFRIDRSGPPILFETMVFRGGSGDEMDRYATWDEAADGHRRMVARVSGPPKLRVVGGGKA